MENVSNLKQGGSWNKHVVGGIFLQNEKVFWIYSSVYSKLESIQNIQETLILGKPG